MLVKRVLGLGSELGFRIRGQWGSRFVRCPKSDTLDPLNSELCIYIYEVGIENFGP